MSFIWYNPETSKYQFGNLRNYRESIANSDAPERFTLLSKLPDVNESLLIKVTRRLNMADLV
jgi:hypothetical protein